MLTTIGCTSRANMFIFKEAGTHMPQWRQYREMLNSLPLAHEDWVFDRP